MNIKYRPAAISDIQNAFAYISDVLKNKSAAVRLKTNILRGISLLKEDPLMGTPLSSKYDGLETEMRFIVISKQMIFYEPHEAYIEIIRVLDGRTDYMTHLFG